MATELRKTGIVGDVPWGTHLCNFYETKEDLLEILIPYFKTGLENNEFCVWVLSDPLSDEEAINALRRAVPNADRYLAAGHIEIVPHTIFPPSRQQTSPTGRIEIIPHTEWYLKGGAFIAERVIDGWNEKLADALAKGYAGLRANGNVAWLTEENRKDFFQYERTLDERLADQRMIVLCSYPLSSSSATEIFDVVNTHQLAIVRRRGNWEILESPELKHAKAESARIGAELDMQVAEQEEFDSLPGLQPSVMLRYAIPIIAVVISLAATFLLQPYVFRTPLFFLSIMISTWVGGIRAGLLAAFLSALAINLFLSPAGILETRFQNIPNVIAFLITALLVGSWSETRRRAEQSLRKARDELENKVQERTAGLRQMNQALQAEIIDHKRSQEALRASEARLQAAIDAADIGLWDWNLVSGQITWLGHYNKLFGFAPGEFEGTYTGLEESVHPKDLEELNRVVQRARDEGSEYAHEYRIIWLDGSIHWIAGRGRFVYNEARQPVRMCGAVLDITARKQAEERLRQSEFDLAEAQRVARLGSWSFDIATNTVRWSEELYRVFDVDKTAFGGTYETFLSRVHPDDRTRVLQVNAEVRSNGTPFEVEYRITTRGGQLKHIREVGYAKKDREGVVSSMFGTAQDITDLKQKSEQLRALSARLQMAKEEESTRIAREIHDELGGALTSLRWGLEEVGDVVSEATDQTQLAALRKRIEAMVTLTETTLDTVRRLASELRPMALDELGLVEAIEWQALQFENRTGIAVQYECSLEKVDLNNEQSTAVFRILQEALTNILRHAGATKVTVTMKQEAGEFLLTIKDNGRGITESERSGAYSLGLLGMRERAHLISADIEITGIEGKETVVAVRIPVSEPDESRDQV